jgi:hypothetical protein
VTLEIIDLFEGINVNRNHRGSAPEIAVRAFDLLCQPLVEVAAIAQPGERIAIGHRSECQQARQRSSKRGILAPQSVDRSLRGFSPQRRCLHPTDRAHLKGIQSLTRHLR